MIDMQPSLKSGLNMMKSAIGFKMRQQKNMDSTEANTSAEAFGLIIFGLGNDQLSRLAACPLARPTGAACRAEKG